MDKLIKCPGCSEVVLLGVWFYSHKCQRKITEGCNAAGKYCYCNKTMEVENFSTHKEKHVDLYSEYSHSIKYSECSHIVFLPKQCGRECQTARAGEIERLRNECKNAQLQLKKSDDKQRDIKKDLDSCKIDVNTYKTSNKTLLKKKKDLEADLKATKEQLEIITKEKEFLVQDLADSKEKISYLYTEINNLSKRINDLTCEKDESFMKHEKSLEKSLTSGPEETVRSFRSSDSCSSKDSSIVVITNGNEEGEYRPLQSDTEIAEYFHWEMISSHETKNAVKCAERLNVAYHENLDDRKCLLSRIEAPENYGFMANVICLLEEKKGIDVTFVLETSDGKTEVFAHQVIIAARSSFFANKFYSKGRDKEYQIIHLKEVNPKAFEKMIRYCYDDKPEWKTTEEACNLFRIASKFKVVSLINLCAAFLKNTKIEAGNVFSILQASEEMKDNSFRKECLKFLEEKTGEIISSYELCDVTPYMVHIILDLEKLSLNCEYELINWIFEWAKVKSIGEDSSCENARDYLEKLLQDMNFLSLTVEQFSMLCENNPDMFSEDEKAGISMNILSIFLNKPIPGMMAMPDFYDKDLKPREYTRAKV